MLNKPTFYQLRTLHGGSILDISRSSGIHPLIVWSMLIGREVEVLEAHMVLCGFNDLCGTHYTMDDIQVTLIRKAVGQAVH